MTRIPFSIASFMLAAFFAVSASAATALPDDCWRAVPATGVEMSITRDAGAVRTDIDFRGRGGYGIVRCDRKITLPENFELAFQLRGEIPRNTLEVKFIRGEDVWWSVRREHEFARDWRRLSVKKRNVEFAWGPSGPGPLPAAIDAIEIVVSAGTGGKGSIWIDDAKLSPLETTAEGPLPHVQNVPWTGAGPFVIDLGARRELGGIVIDWRTAPSSYTISTSFDRKTWSVVRRVASTNGGRDPIHLPDGDARWLRLEFDRASIDDVRLLPPMKSENEFFTALAADAPRGEYPRYFAGEQSYWTVVGNASGELEEALVGEDGAVEAGDARFTIEPFLLVDGKLVTWRDVEIRQAGRAGAPVVEWVKHLRIAARPAGRNIAVRYTAAPGTKLFLAIRPFQVNPQWQFLRRTGGAVRIHEIARQADGSVKVVADKERVVRPVTKPSGFGAVKFDDGEIVEHLRRGKLPEAQAVTDENGFASAAFAFDVRDVTIEVSQAGHQAGRLAPDTIPPFKLEVLADPRIGETIDAQLQYILINRDGPMIQPGSRSYERAWIRDGSLTSAALLRLGRTAEVLEFINWYARAIDERGYVPCCVGPAGADPVPEHDSHGQFIYLVAEYYRFTRDREFLKSNWPLVERVTGFIDTLRKERMTEKYRGTRFWGLVPESISHEGYSAKPMHSYWDDFFILKGLKDAAFLAGELGRSDVANYEALRDEFRTTLLASIDQTIKETGIDYIPGSAELGDFDATSTTIAVSPVDEALSLPPCPLERTFDRYLQQAFQPRRYTPYELRIVGTLARLRRRAEAHAVLDWLLADQRPAAWRQWAEALDRNPRQPIFVGDMPHTWVGSDFIRSALDLIAFEEGDRLVIGAGVTREWAERGVGVSGLRTHFGILNLSITPQKAGMPMPILVVSQVRFTIGGTVKPPPGGIVVVSPYDSDDERIVRTLPAEVEFSRSAILDARIRSNRRCREPRPHWTLPTSPTEVWK